MRSILVSAALLVWAAVTNGAPTVVYPLADQQPPVARVGQPFTFDLLPGTFSSNGTAGNITYSAAGLPAWLQFSSAQTTFYGIPNASHVGTANVSVSASDSTGVTTTSILLVISNDPAPVAQLGFPAQIAAPDTRQFASAQAMPNGTGISVPPTWSFALGWNGNTFSSSKQLFYSAHVRGTTSLPEWLTFSNTTFTFNGVSPWEPACFPIVVTASDVWGYSAAETSFVLSVGNGEAPEFGLNFTALNTTAYNNVTYQIDTSKVTVGGRPTADVVVSVDFGPHKWLAYDNETKTIAGTVPESWISGTVTPMSIPVTLASTNTSNTLTNIEPVMLNIIPYCFTSNHLPNATSTTGSTFAYDIEPYLRNKEVELNATVTPREAASWLIYYPENYTLVGTPPANITYNSIDVVFMGTQHGVSATTAMRMDITGLETPPPPAGEPTPVPTGTLVHDSGKTKKIIIGVVVGVGGFLLLLGLLLLWLCCKRRRRPSKEAFPALGEDPDKTPRNSVLPEKSPQKSSQKSPQKSRIIGFPGFGGRRGSRPPSLAASANTLTKSPAKSAAESDTTFSGTPVTPKDGNAATVRGTASHRVGSVKGLFGTVEEAEDATEALSSQANLDRHNSFMGQPEQLNKPKAQAPKRLRISDSLESGESLESWESPRSFHWSDEDVYLPPLMPSNSATPTSTGKDTNVLADEPRVPPTAARAGSSPARPLPGFYPRLPRKLRSGETAPFMSTDEVPTSYSEFSELNRGRSSQSLDDSFRANGSAVATFSEPRYPSSAQTFGSPESRHPSDSDDSGSSFHPPSGLGRFTATKGMPGYTESPDEVVRSVTPSPMRPHNYTEITPPARPVMAGPIMPTGLQPVARRRASSSRRTVARIHATREHIVGPSTPVPPADEYLAEVGSTEVHTFAR